MLRALIFDVDGTLAETEDLHRQAFNDAFAEMDLPWIWSSAFYADLLAVMGGKERLAHYVETHHAGDLPTLRPRLAEIHDRKTRIYGELVAAGRLGLRPGVARLVAEARAGGVRLAVASTTSRPNVEALLRMNFPRGDVPFDVIACGDEAARKKPAPDVFELALARLGVAAAEAIAFEDSVAGIRSALDAGLPVIATRSRYTETHRLDGAFSALSDLGEPDAPHTLLSGIPWPGGAVTLAGLKAWQTRREAGS
ncbi:MAG: HAD-IA family hydrolase [Methylobacterium sp.]|jgi:HAD superfamily hydrolase (TIGR01509 family)|uniref:HAD-IA family hydrolase n=1 Tax=unclassified Methylobacterium TaxID=2615210 RepID=UPI0011C9C1D0|nr:MULTISPECIES: HAD-IA family hydrolase [unclassified Methylobacterium]MDO9428925.1 HAD-IA family hydrolase [Methylobacterium sp.]TXM71917.1 HAD-IA family hydrolase [Methylobacterium sp. WL69]